MENMIEQLWNYTKNFRGDRQRIYVSEETSGTASELYVTKSGIYQSFFPTGMAAAYSNKKPTKERLNKKQLDEIVSDIAQFDLEGMAQINNIIRGAA